MAQRLRLSRKKGFRLPLNAKSVARPSIWGNPFRIGDNYMWLEPSIGVPHPVPTARDVGRYESGLRVVQCPDPQTAVDWYQKWLFWPESGGAANIRVQALKLAGLDLACWCPLDSPCHADVLLRLANRTTP